jgi:hypothetical protein
VWDGIPRAHCRGCWRPCCHTVWRWTRPHKVVLCLIEHRGMRTCWKVEYSSMLSNLQHDFETNGQLFLWYLQDKGWPAVGANGNIMVNCHIFVLDRDTTPVRAARTHSLCWLSWVIVICFYLTVQWPVYFCGSFVGEDTLMFALCHHGYLIRWQFSSRGPPVCFVRPVYILVIVLSSTYVTR